MNMLGINLAVGWFEVATITTSALFFTYARVGVQKVTSKIARDYKIKEDRKFSESCWKVLYYTTAWLFGMYILINCDWFPKTVNCWVNYPNVPMEMDLRLFYLFQLGFYFHSLYAHLVYETKRSDYWPLFFHHVVTIWLIYFSYVGGFHRIGHLILVFHDTNDIFLEYGKTLVYREKEKESNYVFVAFVISWVVTRLTLLPFMLIRSTLFESVPYLPGTYQYWWYPFNLALLFLQGLHIYWFGMMIRMAIRLFSGKTKKIVDTREVQAEVEVGEDDRTFQSASHEKQSKID